MHNDGGTVLGILQLLNMSDAAIRSQEYIYEHEYIAEVAFSLLVVPLGRHGLQSHTNTSEVLMFAL